MFSRHATFGSPHCLSLSGWHVDLGRQLWGLGQNTQALSSWGIGTLDGRGTPEVLVTLDAESDRWDLSSISTHAAQGTARLDKTFRTAGWSLLSTRRVAPVTLHIWWVSVAMADVSCGWSTVEAWPVCDAATRASLRCPCPGILGHENKMSDTASVFCTLYRNSEWNW
jgi:hypothetical protein